jgi:hypothetical protein
MLTGIRFSILVCSIALIRRACSCCDFPRIDIAVCCFKYFLHIFHPEIVAWQVFNRIKRIITMKAYGYRFFE